MTAIRDGSRMRLRSIGSGYPRAGRSIGRSGLVNRGANAGGAPWRGRPSRVFRDEKAGRRRRGRSLSPIAHCPSLENGMNERHPRDRSKRAAQIGARPAAPSTARRASECGAAMASRMETRGDSPLAAGRRKSTLFLSAASASAAVSSGVVLVRDRTRARDRESQRRVVNRRRQVEDRHHVLIAESPVESPRTCRPASRRPGPPS